MNERTHNVDIHSSCELTITRKSDSVTLAVSMNTPFEDANHNATSNRPSRREQQPQIAALRCVRVFVTEAIDDIASSEGRSMRGMWRDLPTYGSGEAADDFVPTEAHIEAHQKALSQEQQIAENEIRKHSGQRVDGWRRVVREAEMRCKVALDLGDRIAAAWEVINACYYVGLDPSETRMVVLAVIERKQSLYSAIEDMQRERDRWGPDRYERLRR